MSKELNPAEELKNNIDSAIETKANEVMETVNTKANAEEVEVLKAEVVKATENTALLQNQIDELKASNQNTEITVKTGTHLSELLNEKKDAIAAIKKGESVMLDLKDFTGSTGAGSAPYGDERVADIKYDPNYSNRLRGVLMTGATSGTGAIRYSQETAETDSSAGKGKGAAGTQSAVTLTDVHQPIITLFNVLTLPQEWVDDVAMIESYLSTRLMGNLMDVEDDQLLNGSGSGNNYRGINTAAVAKVEADFDTFFGSLANSYGTSANHYDVLTAAKAGLANTNFRANCAILNPIDAAKLATLKASTNEYVLHQTVSPNGEIKQFWNGMEVIESPAQNAGTFTVFDKNAAQYWMREGVSVEFGMNDDDFASNSISVRAIIRGAVATYLPAGIVTGLFSEAILSLNA